MESPSSDPEKMGRVQDTFLCSTSITHRDRRIDSRTSWLWTSQPQGRNCKPPLHQISTPYEYGKHRPPPKNPAPPIATVTAEIMQQVLTQNQELM